VCNYERVKRESLAIGACPSCGCSEADACLVHGIPCCWIETDDGRYCSACIGVEELAQSDVGRYWLQTVLTRAAFGQQAPYLPCGEQETAF